MRINSIDYKFNDVVREVDGVLNVRLTTAEVAKLHMDFHTSDKEYVIMPKDEFHMRTMINNSYYGMYGTGARDKKMLNIKKVIFNDPATIVLWMDGTKTVVKCTEGDTYDKEKGLALCIIKKLCNNDSKDFHNIFKTFIKEEQ